MNKRKILIGAILSVILTLLLFLILELIKAFVLSKEVDDFQYHDSYFVVVEPGVVGYLIIGFSIFTFYLLLNFFIVGHGRSNRTKTINTKHKKHMKYFKYKKDYLRV